MKIRSSIKYEIRHKSIYDLKYTVFSLVLKILHLTLKKFWGWKPIIIDINDINEAVYPRIPISFVVKIEVSIGRAKYGISFGRKEAPMV